jgi:hypothetical protein
MPNINNLILPQHRRANKSFVYKSVAEGIEAATKEELIDQWLKQNIFHLHKIGTGELFPRDPDDCDTLKLVIKTTVSTASIADNTIAYREGLVGDVSYLSPSIAALFNTVQIDSAVNRGRVVRYMDQKTITRAAAATNEGIQAPESSVDWEEKILFLERVADSIPITREAFLDIDIVRQDIMRLLDINIQLIEDQYMWNSDGIATKIKGLFFKAPVFAAGVYAETIPEANLFDLLSIMRATVMKSRRFTPDFALINPEDAVKFKLKKVNGLYVLPQMLKENRALDGMAVVESSQVAVNTLAIGDSRYGSAYEYETEIAAGYSGDGFKTDTLTIRAIKYTNLLIRDVDVNAFLKVNDINAALASLDPAVV